MGFVHSHSYAEMNVHVDGVESHRNDLIMLVEQVLERNQVEDDWLSGQAQ